ncbi:mediator of RNA polymerase II transcription subunit 10-like [Ptychodera flava]|uniref:mediator of RNA polymerase II transcription subunit 10-like n=1 Tax=Ptychodera flava TaxID=63121 RepID=UPI003969F356
MREVSLSKMASHDRFEQLEQNLEMFIENTRQMGIIVSDFQPQGQNVLNQKILHMVTGMQEIEKCRSYVQDVHVPLEVFEYIDQGKNPQLYTKDCMEKALAKNEQVKGKIDTFRRFKSQLVHELSKMFPEEMDRYKTLRELDKHSTTTGQQVIPP